MTRSFHRVDRFCTNASYVGRCDRPKTNEVERNPNIVAHDPGIAIKTPLRDSEFDVIAPH